MAEQEACAELVDKASSEAITMKESQESNTVHGESLLLPLLQGLLDTPAVDSNDQHNDSGTESGEDLRSGLIIEVQSALDKLSASLKNPSTNISEEKRDSLLVLVNRLQTGLSSQITPSSSGERRSSLRGKFSKRRHQRPNRHTVGVTTEELENARRLMEEISFQQKGISPDIWASSNETITTTTPLQKQNSEGSVTPQFKHLSSSKTKPVKNVTAKPFISSNATSQSQSGTSSTVETPSTTSGSFEFLLEPPQPLLRNNTDNEYTIPNIQQQPTLHHSISLESYPPPSSKKQEQGENKDNKKRFFLTETKSLDYSRDVDLISIQKAVTQAAAIKQLSQMKSDVSEDGIAATAAGEAEDADDQIQHSEESSEEDDEDDDDASTVKVIAQKEEIEVTRSQQPQPDLILQTNPTYYKPSASPEQEDDEYPTTPVLNDKANRFNSKKLKMKRANTIDIPKPLKYYEYDEEDSENDENGNTNVNNNRRNSYLALRGPIRVGKLNAETRKVPDFELKTESDRKFAAFLGKHADNNNIDKTTKSSSMWCKQQPTSERTAVNNWTNKFGNIKNNFENVQTSNSVNSARNFWKSADDAVSAGKVSNFGPKISRQSARNLQQMFEEKQKQSQQQQRPILSNIANMDKKNIVTGSLKVDTKSNKNMTVVTQPNSINKFSHAPMSAFKPVVGKKLEEPSFLKPKPVKLIRPKPINVTNLDSIGNDGGVNMTTPESPLYLYSPKNFSPQSTSPVNFIPPPLPKNLGKNEGGRVLSLVAAKFENNIRDKLPEHNVPVRKMSKERITIPPGLLQQSHQNERSQEKLTAPYLVKSVAQNSNSVRKLSGQYDSMGNRDIHQNVMPLRQPQQQPKIFVPGENYTIRYEKPTIAPPKKPTPQQPKVYNAEYTVTQHYYNEPLPTVNSKDNTFNTKSLPDMEQLSSCVNHHQIYENDQTQRPRTYSQSEIYSPTTSDHSDPIPSVFDNDQVQIHNKLQLAQIRNQKVQQNPNYTKYQSYSQHVPNIEQHRTSCTQPEIYNENSRKPEDDHQYTSNYHFKPQMQQSQQRQSPLKVKQPKTYETRPNLNSPYDNDEQYMYKNSTPDNYYENPKNCDIPYDEKHDYYRNVSNFEHGETQNTNVSANPHDNSYAFHIHESIGKPAHNYERQTSAESVKEYNAVSSKVMSGPVSQQAVTVQQNIPKNRQQHDMELNLKASLQKFSSSQLDGEQKNYNQKVYTAKQNKHENISKEEIRMPKTYSAQQSNRNIKEEHSPLTLYNNVKQRPSLRVNDKPLSLESLEINERGESVLTSKFHIPVVKHADFSPPIGGGHELSKSESWHQICQSSQKPVSKPSPRASPSSRLVSRSKSSHTLSVPKQFEAGMSKTEMLEKKRTMEAYFGVSKTPQTELNTNNKNNSSKKATSSSINRVKTSQKISTQRQNSSSGLCRSKTLPDIVCLDKLDDNNIDAVFEDLFNASM